MSRSYSVTLRAVFGDLRAAEEAYHKVAPGLPPDFLAVIEDEATELCFVPRARAPDTVTEVTKSPVKLSRKQKKRLARM